MAAVHDLLEALSSTGITIEARDDGLRYRPVEAMTPDLLAAVKSCKAELSEILLEPAKDSKADAEFDRLERVTRPMPGGGWYDPSESPTMPAGVAIEDWQKFESDCGRLGQKKRDTA